MSEIRMPDSFLLAVTCEGQVHDVFWMHPSDLLAADAALSTFFDAASEADLKRWLQQPLAQASEGSLDLRDPKQNKLRVFLHRKEGQALILGLWSDVLEKPNHPRFAAFAHELLREWQSLLEHSDTFESRSKSRQQFEEIQRLNNSLINTQRELKRANAKLKRLNQELNNRLVKDPLTGLVSRYQYAAEIESRIARAPDAKGLFVFIDVDNLKKINDSYGHQAGDAYLVTFAQRLANLPLGDFVCMRLAGDEFGLYRHGFEEVTLATMQSIWQQIEKAMHEDPFRHDGHEMELSCSAGFAVYGEDTDRIFQLVDYADFAMYQAKRRGKNTFVRFDLEAYRHDRIT